MYSIGVIGYGFVGEAMCVGCKHFGFNDVKIYDPHKIPNSKLDDVLDTDFVFICVPTPMAKGGCIDDSIVEGVLEELNSLEYQGIAVIKSTLLPTSVSKFVRAFSNLKIATNPEFLTERSANEDFINSKWVVLGGYTAGVLRDFYEKMFGDQAKIVEVSAEVAMMAKYMTNTWFSVKVSLMNEFYELWEAMQGDGIDGTWEDVVTAFSHDDRVGPTHLQVPGPDGDFGFGGKCFPKDLNALKSLSNMYGASTRVMQAAWDDNKSYRNNKDWLKIDGAVTDDYKEA